MKLSRTKILSGLIVMWALAFVIFYSMPLLEAQLLAGKHLLFDYMTWQNGAAENWGYRLLWVIGDLSEGTVHKSLFASIGLLLFGFYAHTLFKKNSNNQGFSICAGLGLFPWVVVAAFSGMLVSSALYANNLTTAWVPTFLPGCTIPPAIVFLYGKGWKVSLTGGIISGIIQFPLGYGGMQLAAKIGLPGISGSAVFGMAISGIIICEIVKRLPWMKSLVDKQATEAAEAAKNALKAESTPEVEKPLPPTVGTGVFWMIRRSLADFTEIYFMGNEIAGLGLVLGLLLSWLLNPAHCGYGGPNFTSAILAGQFMASSLAIFFHYDKWQKFGWYNTFTASIALGAFVLTFGATIQVLVLGAILAAALCPFFAATLAAKLNKWPGVVGGTAGMGIAIGICSVIMKAILPLIS